MREAQGIPLPLPGGPSGAELQGREREFFVHDGINSVADYNSLRVGVGCRMDVCRMDVC